MTKGYIFRNGTIDYTYSITPKPVSATLRCCSAAHIVRLS